MASLVELVQQVIGWPSRRRPHANHAGAGQLHAWEVSNNFTPGVHVTCHALLEVVHDLTLSYAARLSECSIREVCPFLLEAFWLKHSSIASFPFAENSDFLRWCRQAGQLQSRSC